MSKIVQLHGMSTAQASVYTGPQREVIVDTGAFALRVQDGATPGGYKTCMASLNLADIASPATARGNLGAAPLDNPNFTTNAQVVGDTIITQNAVQTLINKTFTAPVLGTPGSGNLTNCTGYDMVDLVGMGANITTFLATPTSANLAAAITNETGGGNLVFNTNPTFSGTIGGALTWSSGQVILGDVTAGHFLANGAGGGLITVTGFGNTTTLDNDGSILTTSGNGMRMICVSNGVILTNSANAWAAISDKRTKTAFKPILKALDKVDKLNPVTYKYKTDKKNRKRRVGLIAQDVQKVLPEAVCKDKKSGMLVLSLEQVVPLLVAAIQELRLEVKKLKGKK